MTMRNWLVFAGMIGVLFAMIVVYGVQYDPTSQAMSDDFENFAEGDTLRVSAKALAGAFAKDERRAEKVFENKLCEVTGHIVEIDENWLGEPVVMLEGDRVKGVAVSLIFQKSQQGVVDLLEVGENVSVLGICMGIQPRYGIRFKQCVLVSRAEPKGQWDMREK